MPLVETFSYLSEIPTHTLLQELKGRDGINAVSIGPRNAICFDQEGPAMVIFATGAALEAEPKPERRDISEAGHLLQTLSELHHMSGGKDAQE